MKSLSLLIASSIALGLASSPALALSSRTFVSGAGSDTGSCGLTAPCRTFAYALTQTAASGEIIVLSSAGYGPVTINKAVSIINTSSFAGVTVASGNGITINAGTGDSVTLVGLTIDGGGIGSNGVVFNSGGKLTIDQCNLMNFVGTGSAGNGVIIQPTFGNQNIAITNTTASNNQYAGIYYLPTSSATDLISIDGVTAKNNGYGIAINNESSLGPGKVAISNSIASFNTIDGFYFDGVTAASLDASNATGNVHAGVLAIGGTNLAVGRSAFMNNGSYGLDVASAMAISYKDNRIAGNGTNALNGTMGTATLY